MTPHEVAAETGLSYDAVRRAIASGELKAARVRRRILIRRDWFDAWIDAHVLAPATITSPSGRPRRVTTVPNGTGAASADRLDAIERGDL